MKADIGIVLTFYSLFLSTIGYAMTELKDSYFQLRVDMRDTTSSQDISLVTKSENLLQCARACAEKNHCISIFYHVVSGFCSGHYVIYTSGSSPGISSQPNTSYWEVNGPYDKIGCVPMTSTPGYCIQLHTELLLWQDQIDACVNEHMEMASLSTSLRHTFAANYLTGVGHSSAVSVYAYKSSGVWQWNDGTPVDMALFGPDEPTNGADEECGLLAAATGFMLNDARCTNPRAFLCDRTIYK